MNNRWNPELLMEEENPLKFEDEPHFAHYKPYKDRTWLLGFISFIIAGLLMFSVVVFLVGLFTIGNWIFK